MHHQVLSLGYPIWQTSTSPPETCLRGPFLWNPPNPSNWTPLKFHPPNSNQAQLTKTFFSHLPCFYGCLIGGFLQLHWISGDFLEQREQAVECFSCTLQYFLRTIANISFGFRLMLVPNMMTVYLTCEYDREIAKKTLQNIVHTLKTVNLLSYASSRKKAGEDEGSISWIFN